MKVRKTKRKYSDSLSLRGKNKMWNLYKKDPKGCRNFEEFCSQVVKAKEKIISRATLI